MPHFLAHPFSLATTSSVKLSTLPPALDNPSENSHGIVIFSYVSLDHIIPYLVLSMSASHIRLGDSYR